jgi:hypothetical protein
MNTWIAYAAAAPLLGVAMVGCIELGRWFGRRRGAAGPAPGVGAMEGAVFALLGLLIAFTFSGAASRFDQRRTLVTEEANDIGTAWLRLDVLPADAQPAIRELFRKYLDSRLATYRALPDLAAAEREMGRSAQLQTLIWTQAVSATRRSESTVAAMLLLPALNAMIDITTTRKMASMMHPPLIVFLMLGALALASALLAGHGMAGSGTRNWMHVIGFATIVAGTVYVIVDMEYPRLGLIRVDAIDLVLTDLRRSMD